MVENLHYSSIRPLYVDDINLEDDVIPALLYSSGDVYNKCETADCFCVYNCGTPYVRYKDVEVVNRHFGVAYGTCANVIIDAFQFSILNINCCLTNC